MAGHRLGALEGGGDSSPASWRADKHADEGTGHSGGGSNGVAVAPNRKSTPP